MYTLILLFRSNRIMQTVIGSQKKYIRLCTFENKSLEIKSYETQQ